MTKIMNKALIVLFLLGVLAFPMSDNGSHDIMIYHDSDLSSKKNNVIQQDDVDTMQELSAVGKLTKAENLVVAADNGLIFAFENQEIKIAEKLGAGVAVAVEAQGAKVSLRYLDSSVGHIEKLERAIELFKNTPGAVGKDGAITKLIENGKRGADAGMLGTARGAAYELEAALEIEQSGEKILEIGKKIKGRDFDLVIKDSLIECKNINWGTLSQEKSLRMKGIFGDQVKIALGEAKSFVIYSKQSIPEDWVNWFIEKSIKFVVSK
ncbi:MAG: hypothetical protein P4L31_01340 [Candidatus Babeliales bacterium]|nr:hypothetical protein [Candidatus Babeliales bacterium]